MSDEQRQYLSYLLRLWQEPVKLQRVWRASLEDPQTGELLGFGDVAQLFAFLEQQIADPPAHAAPASVNQLLEEIIARLEGDDKGA